MQKYGFVICILNRKNKNVNMSLLLSVKLNKNKVKNGEIKRMHAKVGKNKGIGKGRFALLNSVK